MQKEMLINTVEGRECRIAVLENGTLEELYMERASSASQVGNVYKGRVTNVEPGIQAAFIDFGGQRNGFLHISDLHPQYFPKGERSGLEPVGRKRPQRDRPPIQACLRRGQEIVVQMTKEGIGTKGPTLSTYLSIPGRMLVMMPGMTKLGVSRKVEDDNARNKARQILSELKVPDDMGFIVRTAGIGQPKREINRDLNYLLRLWKSINKKTKSTKSPAELYQESDLVTRTVRDVYNSDIKRIICDNEDVARKVKDFLDVAMPRTKHKVELYTGNEGLFHDVGLETEIERIYSRRVELKSGGSLIIDQTEALVAIDVNSGRFRQHSDAETTATKLNLEAAREVARQLRLRDMGGVIVIDFIDMREAKNRRSVEKALRDAIKNDRAKTKILRISALGIVEMTRQRVRPSLKQSIYARCPHCDGMGLIKSEESQALLVMRDLQRVIHHPKIARVEAFLTLSAATHLTNYHRHQIASLEQKTGKRIIISIDDNLGGHEVRFECTDSRGASVHWDPKSKGASTAGKVDSVPIDQVKPGSKTAPKSEPDTGSADQDASDQSDSGGGDDGGESSGKSKKRRRRGRRRRKSDRNQDTSSDQGQQKGESESTSTDQGGDDGGQSDKDRKEGDQGGDDGGESKGKSRRRGRRRGGKKESSEKDQQGGGDSGGSADGGESSSENDPSDQGDQKPKAKRSRRRRKKSSDDPKGEEKNQGGDSGQGSSSSGQEEQGGSGGGDGGQDKPQGEDKPKAKRPRRRRKKSSEDGRGGEVSKDSPEPSGSSDGDSGGGDSKDKPKPRRRRKKVADKKDEADQQPADAS